MYANKINDLAQVISFQQHLVEYVEEIVESWVFNCAYIELVSTQHTICEKIQIVICFAAVQFTASTFRDKTV